MADSVRLTTVLEFIRQHPEQHEQMFFRRTNDCGTTMCFAGHTIAIYAPEGTEWKMNLPADDKGGTCGWIVTTPDGVEHDSSVLAAELLDLDPDESDALFYNMGDAEALAEIVDDIKSGYYGEGL